MNDIINTILNLKVDTIITYSIIGIVILLAIIVILLILPSSGKNKKQRMKSNYKFTLDTESGKIYFYNPFTNFLIYGGSGSGKTFFIGKNLLSEFIRHKFAGFIYDYKDSDLTRTANYLVQRHNYPYRYYYINFVDLSRSYRVNPIKPEIVNDENLFVQLMSDLLRSFLKGGREDEWFSGALGILKGVAIRFYYDYPEKCTIPHIVNFICSAGAKNLTNFILGNDDSRKLASAFIDSAKSERTQASYLSSLTNYISDLAFNKKIAYVLSGDDFEYNLIDPDDPKLVSVANAFKLEDTISPVIALMLTMSSRQFTLANKIDFCFFLDEATTFKVNNMEALPSVLREYRCAFTFITQSSAKIENTYSKLERSALEANMGNQFFGRTGDDEALKSYPVHFGTMETERKSYSSGLNVSGKSSSTTRSTQKENKYEPAVFKNLETGEFIGTTAGASDKEFKTTFKPYKWIDLEPDIPVVRTVLPIDVEKNYQSIKNDITMIIRDLHPVGTILNQKSGSIN